MKGCVEVKPDYQWRLLHGENLLDALDVRHHDVAPAICQVSCHTSLPHVVCFFLLNMWPEEVSISFFLHLEGA